MENCILYDWLTFSVPDFDLDSVLAFLNLPTGLSWSTGLGSKLKYGERWAFQGISVHFTSTLDSRRLNAGVCVEMSGQGCRAYETYSGHSMSDLVSRVRSAGYSVTRVDIAYDDFEGKIDLDHMADQARDFHFTSRLQRRKIVDESQISDLELAGLTVSHGSKSSRIYIRCYDKRIERNAMDLYPHWVRLEIQLRDENAIGFLDAPEDIGTKFAGVLRNYLSYRDPSPTDSNKRRWKESSWWTELLGAVQAIKISSSKDVDYNKDHFDEFVYGHLHNVIRTAVLCDGAEGFLRRVFAYDEKLPSKYMKLLETSGCSDSAELQSFFDVLNGTPGAHRDPDAPCEYRYDDLIQQITYFEGEDDD